MSIGFVKVGSLRFEDTVLIRIGRIFYWAYYKDLVYLSMPELLVITRKGNCIRRR